MQALTSSLRTERSVSVVSACSEVVILAQRLTELALNFPSSPSIPVISVRITAAPSVICSADELESLKSIEEIFDDALANIVEALEAIQEQLSTLTGNTYSPESTTTESTDNNSPTTTDTNSQTTNSVNCSQCVFPFIFFGIESDRCTTMDEDPDPWCATEVDSNGKYLDWEYCTDPSCPGLEGNSEEMSVHPLNDVGNCCKSSS